jgi:hypothetical protein
VSGSCCDTASLANATFNGGTATCNSDYSSSLGRDNPAITCNNGMWNGVCYKKCDRIAFADPHNPSSQTGKYNHGTIVLCNIDTTNSMASGYNNKIICQNGSWYLDNDRDGIIEIGENREINQCYPGI